jgi:hypothetical protein
MHVSAIKKSYVKFISWQIMETGELVDRNVQHDTSCGKYNATFYFWTMPKA